MFFTFNKSLTGFVIKRYADRASLLADTPELPTIGYWRIDAGSFSGAVDVDEYVISATEPENPTEKLVWLQIGTTGFKNLPVLNDGSVYVYPIKAQIYDNGKWYAFDAYVYVDGWSHFGRTHLYWGGDTYTDENGAWEDYPAGYSGESTQVSKSVNENGSLTLDYTSELLGTGARLGMWLGKLRKIDLTFYKTLVFTGLFAYENTYSYAIYGVWSDMPTNYRENHVASAEFTENNTEPVVIDVSALEGEYYVGVGVRSCRLRIDECYIEM